MKERSVRWLVLASLVALLTPPGLGAYSTGITGFSRAGCTCHGLPETPNTTTQLLITGLPAGGYVPGTEYTIDVWVIGIATPATLGAGFNLETTAGKLIAQKGSGARIDAANGQATHAARSQIGAWTLRWRAPSTPVNPVRFHLAGNVVNANDAPDEGDFWSVMPAPVTVSPAQ